MGAEAPLIVTAWERAGGLRARCPRCLQTSTFPSNSRRKEDEDIHCLGCDRALKLAPTLMSHVPTWDDQGSPTDRAGLKAGDMKLLAALGLGLDRHAALLRERPELVLQELGNQLRFDGGAAGEWARQARGAFELLRPGGWATADRSLRRAIDAGSMVVSVALSPDGRLALSGDYDGWLRLWDVETGRQVHAFEGHHGRVLSVRRVLSVAFSPDGRFALSGGEDGRLLLWEVGTKGPARALGRHDRWVSSVAFSPDGRFALAGVGRRLLLWEVGTWQLAHAFEAHAVEVNSVAFSPDGRQALSGGPTAEWSCGR